MLLAAISGTNPRVEILSKINGLPTQKPPDDKARRFLWGADFVN
jgi:hypothetical protein